MKAIINGKIIMKDRIIYNSVIVFDLKIIGIIDNDNFHQYKEECREEINVIDAKGRFVSPGFIDIHIHGSGGYDTMDATKKALKIIGTTIAENGVTGYLPTTMTMEASSIYKALDVVREEMGIETRGAKILGVHVEGPFINEKYKGAQKANNIVKPDYDIIKDYLDIIKIITLAPEKDIDHSFIKKVKANSKITLSIGHSDASFEEAMKAIDDGISHATHIFNAMTPFNHRKPGIVGAIFTSDISCELIADLIHVHPAIFNILINLVHTDRMVLITDSMRAGCIKSGVSELGGQKVIVKNGAARLEDGTLAGSVLTLNKAILNMLRNSDLKIYDVVAMATINPAKVINMDNKKGSLEIGYDADIAIFNDDIDVSFTIVEGKVVYEA
ncbi:N-acetylglucosamine-6-phosphate deacetylase [Clostridium estertheticum]|uniref:N-acetylglucosamine-6-phosphate deacetylase n=1 Tax=Clostridium estertheticum subsp. estertheticum TaxID=1552 RepID=A0A1J0GN19_9CLOT|nr:N-acetylglucosamine-6-phosphate deacetylase [Clostridium estertheticum]APC42762.1 N-acetylglucosamine-6-phosphate deacetylase [Clostridium estertheticum subsp. estertheticum]MBU3073340.1 N-acetylglucosamine-6-phosphate deacetylase [Clostridium estertheticum]MBU3163419.1 N-acetylglucosamine-6-phosphate deacetylase [Clostridium estertheticum]MBU3171493.1 N-acetylglucosamine-6-phosphate deacetylase [Clostridium estertheticum]MBZ9616290.1 N-acetylglucosamine-6-phosphate deacetylase [Clostridium